MEPQDLLRLVLLSPKRIASGRDGVLDLSYITTRLIAAATPTDGAVHSLFRTPLNRLISHLNEQHAAEGIGYWHIWNLHAEGPLYQVEEDLSKNWSFRPFPDHQPPSLSIMLKIVLEIDAFLEKNPHNVALIHCYEGKGRSGTICCAYLMYESKARGIELRASDAREIFTKKRMRRMFGTGVSTRCQIRYLDYWEKYLKLDTVAELNWRLYHMLNTTPFGSYNSRITTLRIYNPSSYVINLRVKLWTYNEANNANILVELALSTISLGTFVENTPVCEVKLNEELSKSTKEIKISFEGLLSLAYAWFNLYFESLEGNMLRPPDSNKTSCSVAIHWKDFDGILGIPGGTPRKLFDYVVIFWELVFNNCSGLSSKF